MKREEGRGKREEGSRGKRGRELEGDGKQAEVGRFGAHAHSEMVTVPGTILTMARWRPGKLESPGRETVAFTVPASSVIQSAPHRAISR
eukprot:2156586-Rhodomonas_salina.1